MLNDDHRSHVRLPDAPASLTDSPVKVWREPLSIDTYDPLDPDPYPAFFEKRVYQGSSGKVYPLPFHERISPVKRPRDWDAIHLENEWVRLVMLPEIGGRIYVGYDKVADYDFFYRNNVIKPALVGLAGPWISGGVEFNWPQHHRPATFLPTCAHIEHEDDGSVTVWMSDHDPMHRMKGMHGVRLRPDSAVVELRARLYNRTQSTQTFLWWANVAAAVNDDYQSFFPTDVAYVADHARRALTSFPAADRPYYGIDYPERVSAEHPDGDRIDWYKNIPVPTSYMVTDTEDDFFGGYDHGRRAGFVHVADRTIAPGKKQWTWGNAPFGWAWDRNLTDTDGPYVELMAGVYTDNQPDFSFIAPGETRTFSQYWYPIQEIGPAHQANLDVAVALDVLPDGDLTRLVAGVCATREIAEATVELLVDGAVVAEAPVALAPGAPARLEAVVGGAPAPTACAVVVREAGRELLRWQPRGTADDEPWLATVPPTPEDTPTQDELALIGSYLDQYRHATRLPHEYWQEALRRDPGDHRAHLALARLGLERGVIADAETHASAAVARLTSRVPNPMDGEAHYLLGLALVRKGDLDAATAAFGKARWSAPWRPAAGYEMARIALRRGQVARAIELLEDSLLLNAGHAQARCALVVALRRAGREAEAAEILAAHLETDPLDAWALALAGESIGDDATIAVDVALELAAVGLDTESIEALERAIELDAAAPLGQVRIAPIAHAHIAAIRHRAEDAGGARAAWDRLESADTLHCLPVRPEDLLALELAADVHGGAKAAVLVGHWCYHWRRYDDAISAWSTALDRGLGGHDEVVALRNLAIAAHNVEHDQERALALYERARALRPDDSRLLYEHDQLRARVGVGDAERRADLEGNRALVDERDDLTTVRLGLLIDAGRADEALAVLEAREFQPWEGGEGMVLAQWDRCHLALARHAMDAGDAPEAVRLLERALAPAENLGEARHPLANTAEIHWELGRARHAAGDGAGARAAWRIAAATTRDFADMSERGFSPQVAYTLRALRDLGEAAAARSILRDTRSAVAEYAATEAEIDYFATSLPTMLLFEDHPNNGRDRLVATVEQALDAPDIRDLESAAPAAPRGDDGVSTVTTTGGNL
ncbi:DUF5107 domain-containing protein [Demequina lignilytica]|uniref:DUF5107 domain-containing protein n=1 Tax=Demequina lignilytica TaxID=3051663 RepID=A0AB35MES2_9MICO|nr:DUF5107 domain-containing protein [Demequina sp. SYSU T0a273]MDN4482261.1 DUF5107 domain-containing protein [Demequina sp. SYSU T0a273]